MIKTVIKKTLQLLRINKLIVKKARGKDIVLEKTVPIDAALEVLEKARPNAGSSCLCDRPDGSEVCDLQIIVPAYNVENYIERCLDSVLRSDAMDEYGLTYMVTVIDDGSTDGTADILQKYKTNGRIKIISQNNQGLSAARNSGLRETNRGKYIMFVDSDDEVDMNVCTTLLKKAIDNNFDIVQGGYKVISQSGKIIKHLHGCDSELKGFAWGKLYKNAVFEHIKFPENYLYEDSVVKQIICRMGYSVYCSPDCLYYYRSNPKGITQSNVKNNRAIDSLYITLQLHDDGQKLGLSINDGYYDYILDMVKLTYARTKYLDYDVQKAIFIVFKNFIFDNFGICKASMKYRLQIEGTLNSGDFGAYKAFCELY